MNSLSSFDLIVKQIATEQYILSDGFRVDDLAREISYIFKLVIIVLEIVHDKGRKPVKGIVRSGRRFDEIDK